MNEFLSSLLQAVIIAAVPVLTTYAVKLIRQVAANAAAKTDSIKMQGYLNEAAQAISEAVEATSQTYVDSLKQADKFTPEAQREAAEKALAACIANISPALQTSALLHSFLLRVCTATSPSISPPELRPRCVAKRRKIRLCLVCR